MNGQAPSPLKPALIAGTAFGVAGAIPVLNWINCACCALIIGCGFVAAWLASRQSKAAGQGFTVGNGAVAGLVSGLVYGIVTGVVSAVLSSVAGVGDWDDVVEQLESLPTMDPAVLDQVNRLMESTGPTVLALAGIFFSIVFGVIFATVGGLIGGAAFKFNPPQPAPVDVVSWSASGQRPPDQAPPPPPPVQPAP
jgi:phage tail protein X